MGEGEKILIEHKGAKGRGRVLTWMDRMNRMGWEEVEFCLRGNDVLSGAERQKRAGWKPTPLGGREEF